jgi:hypothetical protein
MKTVSCFGNGKDARSRVRPGTEKAAGLFRPAAFRIEQISILRNGDLAWFDVLCFRQSQSHEALLDCSGDLAGVDRWIELKRALI